MPVKKRPKLDKTIFDEEFAQDRAARRAANQVDDRIANEEMRRCFDILAYQMEQPVAAVFLEPVDWEALDLPLYPKIVKHPMDYGTIKTRLLSGEVKTPTKFAELMRLVYRNALKFNQAGSQIAEITQKLFDEFEGNFEHVKLEKTPQIAHAAHTHFMDVDSIVQMNPYAELEAKVAELEAKLASLQDQTTTLKAEYAARAEKQALLLQPHLRLEKLDVSYPRPPFTFEEKAALCQRLSDISDQDVVSGLLNVINVSQDSNTELELDVENFDDETLHRMQEYLDEYEAKLASGSRYGYGDDEDYLESVERKRRMRM